MNKSFKRIMGDAAPLKATSSSGVWMVFSPRTGVGHTWHGKIPQKDLRVALSGTSAHTLELII